jgi:hypothetical protein
MPDETGWAIKAKDAEIYIAKEQYGPPGSLTIASFQGSPYYHPRRFATKREAELYLGSVVMNTSEGKRTVWIIVRY